MKLHTKLTPGEVDHALGAAQHAGRIPWDIHFTQRDHGISRSHSRRFDLMLGTWDKRSLLPTAVDRAGKSMHVRKFQNSGTDGAGRLWAATYDEWGWFLAEIYKMDPKAKAGQYNSAEDFHKRTAGQFRNLTETLATEGYQPVATNAPYMSVYYVKEEATTS